MSEQKLVWYEEDPFHISLFIDEDNFGALRLVGSIEKASSGPWYTTDGYPNRRDYDVRYWKTIEDAKRYLESLAKNYTPMPKGYAPKKDDTFD
jgi:hypothetical protein